MPPKQNKSKLPATTEIPTRAADQLASAIERCRKRAGMSQAALARRAGVRQPTVSKVESGSAHTAVGTIYAICAALGLEVVIRERSTDSEFRPEEIFG